MPWPGAGVQNPCPGLMKPKARAARALMGSFKDKCPGVISMMAFERKSVLWPAQPLAAYDRQSFTRRSDFTRVLLRCCSLVHASCI
jgi:hypothetical protein